MSSAIERLTGLHWKRQGPAFLVASGHGATHWVLATFYVLLPYITSTLGLSYTQAGGLVTVFHVSSFVANVGSGAVVDIGGRRVLVQASSLVIGAAALMAMGLADSVIFLVPLVVLIGVTNNLWHPAAISYLSQCYPQNRGYALSVHTLGASVGDAAAPVVAGAMLLTLTWQGTAAIISVPVLAVAALLLMVLGMGANNGDTPGTKEKSGGGYLKGVKDLIANRAIIGLCTMAAFRSMTQNGIMVFVPLYLADVLKVNPFALGLAVMSMQVAGIVSGPAAGVASDRMGRQPVALICMTVSTLAIVAMTMVSTMVPFVLASVLLGLAMFAVRPVIHSWALDLAPDKMGGSVVSLLFASQSALSAFVPLFGGLIADAYGLAAVFYVLAGSMFVANVIVARLPRPGTTAEQS